MRRSTFLKSLAGLAAVPWALRHGSAPHAQAVPRQIASGRIFAADSFSADTKPVYEITGGRRADFAVLNAGGWIGPLAVGPDGRLWAPTSALRGSLWDITPGGDLTAAQPFTAQLFPDGLGYIEGLAFDADGTAYLANSESGKQRLAQVDPVGAVSYLPQIFDDPCGLLVNGSILYVGEGGTGRVLAMNLGTGAVTTLASGFGKNGSHVSAQLARDPRGRLLFLGYNLADKGLWDVTDGGDFSARPPLVSCPFRIDVNQISVDAQNNVYAAGDGDGVIYISRFRNGALAPWESFVDNLGDTESVVVVP